MPCPSPSRPAASLQNRICRRSGTPGAAVVVLGERKGELELEDQRGVLLLQVRGRATFIDGKLICCSNWILFSLGPGSNIKKTRDCRGDWPEVEGSEEVCDSRCGVRVVDKGKLPPRLYLTLYFEFRGSAKCGLFEAQPCGLKIG